MRPKGLSGYNVAMRIYALKISLYVVVSFCMQLVCLLYAGFLHNVYANEPEVVETGEVEEVQVGENTQVENNKIKKTSTSDFSVSPVVTNEKAKPRDIIKKELLITNNTEQRIDLYITVENIDPTEGAQEFTSPAGSDLSTSLANWVEITRGVIELSPGEVRKIPYLIHVNLTAKPGNYYARIQFQKGATRAVAEASADASALMLNVEVVDDANERLQLGNFMSEDGVVFGNSVSFSYLLENVGNRLIEPRGSIRIFNRRGEEVGSVPLNAEGEGITPENKKQLAAVWGATGRFGKYKAFLDLEYGENQLASVQDTVYFWVFPWKEIMVALGGVIVLAIVGTYIVHMRAIATPSHVRRQKQSFTEQFIPQTAMYTPPQKATYAERDRQGASTHVTVLNSASRNQTATPVRSTAPMRHGATVELVSRGASHTANTHGNVVQLSPRR
jgi:hypothetical protein